MIYDGFKVPLPQCVKYAEAGKGCVGFLWVDYSEGRSVSRVWT